MTAFAILIEKIEHRTWRITNQGNIRDGDNNCPLDALILEGGPGGCSTAYTAIGGSERQAWVIMSAADNRINDPFTVAPQSKIMPSEVRDMRERLIDALKPKLEAM